MERQEVHSGSLVAQWYSGRSVLVTGATGFLGKIIVEKLLRSCSGIATVYLLVRPKRGLDPRERLEAYTSHVVFSKLRTERPDFARHLFVVAGDLSAPDFQLAEQDMAALRRDVSVVFHLAASIRFDDSLRQAVATNVVGTQRVLQLAEQLPNLKVFVYVSTSFCHSDHPILEEKLYPSKGDPEKIIDIVSWMDDDLLGTITPKLLGNLPNTYALSKNLAEELVARYADRLPIVIARPSIDSTPNLQLPATLNTSLFTDSTLNLQLPATLNTSLFAVISCWKEPLVGWTHMNGPTGFLIAAGKGVLRVLLADLNIATDFIPVDCTANALIMVAWHVAETSQPSPYVCNITNGDVNRVPWSVVMKMFLTLTETEVPVRPILWYCAPIVTTSPVLYSVCHFFLEVLPAHILDFFIRLSGRKPFLVHINNRLQSAMTMLRYYMVHEWKFINKNILSLYESMDAEDKETFYFNIADVEPYQYCKDGLIGAKLYILNEKMDNIPSDLRYIRRMYWLHITVRALFYGLLLWLLYSWSQPALESLETVMAYLTSLFFGSSSIRALAEKLPVPPIVLTENVDDAANS